MLKSNDTSASAAHGHSRPTSLITNNPSGPPTLTTSSQREYGTLEEGTFAIRIINTLNYATTKLAITKRYTISDIHTAYAPYESHPEYYLWTDTHGKTLDLSKTVVENGLVGAHEVVEFEGIGKEPSIILIFKDGFENDIPRTLNPALLHSVPANTTACRNY